MATTTDQPTKPKANAEVLLKIDRVSKLFDDVRAVDDVS
ncbi:MAG: polyamine ABC transporter ATP-binding protein, partial [Shewanella sp.]